MCAINGFNFSSKELILKMNIATRHRGPDDSGSFVDDDISLGHNRLSIIDLSERGHQPIWNEDKTKCIIFNGEIYNYKELRNDLIVKGHNFSSETDTEVILHLFEEFGKSSLDKINGIFSFAIWDTKTKELFLVRDRVGVKPLYYFYDKEKLIFSSEIKGILEHDIERKVNMSAFNHFFRLRYVPAPLTMFENIFKLPAGHFAVLNKSDLKIVKYWDIENTEEIVSRESAVSEINSLMKDSVKGQLVSDRPVGLFLSGGIDSTSILGITSECLGNAVKTYSVGFDTKIESEKFNADFYLARETARYYKSDHHEIMVSEKDILDNIEEAVYYADEPIPDPIQVVNLLLSHEAKKEVATVLGGDGGDELFGGYHRYYYGNIIDRFQKLPAALKKTALFGLDNFSNNSKLIEKLKSRRAHERYLSFMIEKDNVLNRVLKKDIFNKEEVFSFFADNYPVDFGKFDSPKEMMFFDLKTWLPEQSLMRTDKMSMAYGLEERVPILDHRLVELAFRIPSTMKIKGKEEGKHVFKEAMKDYLPKHILGQPKRGWFSPAAKWLRSDLKDFAYEVLSENYNIGTRQYFDFPAVRQILDDHISKKEYNSNIIWTLIFFQLWYKKFIK
ncbi:MAG: asparagine synthase (glutamine-hydrolyzing) [Parcubacteria group bacterium CG10_big_fil_rev_8_21_14_0_10_38_31]|nr:MAG: asparagine synthase (glutamine-hydrolyzing) [Parcubacteria group bacterium CG10_big_fil_rev_8_21_14_0_10_38_31]